MSENDNCEEKQCPNFVICGTIAPSWVFQCRWGACVNCDMQFGGPLNFKDSGECPICFEENVPLVQMLRCQHQICTSCFKHIFNPEKTPCSEFPYPEIEEGKYDEDRDKWKKGNPNWRIQYPLLEAYEIEEDLCYNLDQEEWRELKEGPLRKCCICRK